ncbi:MAG: DHH family phosphoesterase [Lachnospiraceae bacterium]
MTKFKELFEQAGTIAIAGHIRPDGDCSGSCLGTYLYLKDLFPEKTIHLYLQPIPQVFRFLKGSDEILLPDGEPKEYDMFLVLDCGDEQRLGEASVYFKRAKKTVCIDHHISNRSFADLNFVYPNASSTCELVFGFMEEERITKDIAACIYVGLVHDTGVFQYSNTSARTMEIAGILMEKGINFSRIVDSTFYAKTFEQNKILGYALLNSVLYQSERVIFSSVSINTMQEYQVQGEDLEGIVSQLRMTKEADTAVFIHETAPEQWKVSMRSNEAVNVSDIALFFGGGGHVRAAGFSLTGSPESIIKDILAQIKIQLS